MGRTAGRAVGALLRGRLVSQIQALAYASCGVGLVRHGISGDPKLAFVLLEQKNAPESRSEALTI